jgi:aubergine-like protein
MNHRRPEKIIVYRDGVGDGQIPVVQDYEVRQIQNSFATFGDYQPKLTVVIVQKRINTRIFQRV